VVVTELNFVTDSRSRINNNHRVFTCLLNCLTSLMASNIAWHFVTDRFQRERLGTAFPKLFWQ